MIIQQSHKLWFTSVVAIAVALGSTAALASAMSYGGDEDDDTNLKSLACSIIGCPNGNRLCGNFGGTIKGGAPPFTGEVTVSYTCYESGTSA